MIFDLVVLLPLKILLFLLCHIKFASSRHNDTSDNELQFQCVLSQVRPKNTQVYEFNDLTPVAPGTIFEIYDTFIEYKCTDGFTELSKSGRINYCVKSKNGTAKWKNHAFLGCSRTCSTNIFQNQRQRLVCRDENQKIFNCHAEPHIFSGTTVEIFRAERSLYTKIKCDINGNWTGTLPDCHQYSEVLNSTNNDGITCSIATLIRPSVSLIFPNEVCSNITNHVRPLVYAAGTKVKIVCAEEYVSDGELVSELTCSETGEWTGDEIPKCKVMCGDWSDRDLIKWVTAIYEYVKSPPSYRYICGGNIISAKLVISAAHCFTSDMNYVIGIERGEEDAQFHEIAEIRYLSDYVGKSTHFKNDIVVLVVKTFIKFDTHIKPVCIDFETMPNEIEEDTLDLGHGHIATWNILNNIESSKRMNSTSHPIVADCRAQLSRTKQLKYLTADKFCAGNYNHRTMCHGDSGHGLVFERLVNNSLRFYLYGVLSVVAENCIRSSFVFYTNVQCFKEKIKDLVIEY